MNEQQFTDRDGRLYSRYQYDDGWVVAADLSAVDEAIDVDVVGTTVIVVVERDGDVSESEFEIPGPAESVEVRNGVLTVGGSE